MSASSLRRPWPISARAQPQASKTPRTSSCSPRRWPRWASFAAGVAHELNNLIGFCALQRDDPGYLDGHSTSSAA